ncbi:TetR/AcrR family transcriptional regulator [Actinomadura opuntiae]|uniref:TetR/AcrR family transcriptional regulator n=1 Tax=Actinomadura sp. OS1-43 TaxID=604315 RepID=UPI00255AFEF4|nr:TetR/AcrR family transcriptional regulator [Actinomadura sp. OS1-43]MDL4817346.1 helix-turn-helix domain-containing protein [Actinomadura sp. OS1-43]
MADGTRTRILDEALRLFAERGYAGTSIAAIEEAAGLSPHSGSLYTHFGSKEQVMAAAVERAIEAAERGFALAPMLPLGNLEAELTLVARGSLLLMNSWRDLIRVMGKESEQFPAVMVEARKRLFARSHEFLAEWLAGKAPQEGPDFEAITTIWLGAIENYWVVTNLHGHRPFGMDDDRYVRQWVSTLMTAIGASP